MASTTYNLSETFPVSDIVSKSVSPVRYTENIEDTLEIIEATDDVQTFRTLLIEDTFLDVSDTLAESYTERFSRNLESGLGVGEVFESKKAHLPIVTLEDTVVLNEEFNRSYTLRTIVPMEDTAILSDYVSVVTNDRVDVDFNDRFLDLGDIATTKSTNRFERPLTNTIVLVDVIAQEFGITMGQDIGGKALVNGELFGSFLVGTTVDLTCDLVLNTKVSGVINVFYRWEFTNPLGGITNIYKRNTTLVVPYGGGVVTPILVNLGAIVVPFYQTVIVVDPSVFEYVEDFEGDYIKTIELAEVVFGREEYLERKAGRKISGDVGAA